jgi:hypothetical protein
MFKTSGSGEYHSDAILVAGVNHFLVPDGTAGLHDNLYSRIFNGINAISEREKSIGSQDTAPYFFATLKKRHMDGIYATHLSGTKADSSIVFRDQDTIGLRMAQNFPCE